MCLFERTQKFPFVLFTFICSFIRFQNLSIQWMMEHQRGEKCESFHHSTRCALLLHCCRLKRVQTYLNRRHIPVANGNFGNRLVIWCIDDCGHSKGTNLCHRRSPNEKMHLVSIAFLRYSKTHRCWLQGIVILQHCCRFPDPRLHHESRGLRWRKTHLKNWFYSKINCYYTFNVVKKLPLSRHRFESAQFHERHWINAVVAEAGSWNNSISLKVYFAGAVNVFQKLTRSKPSRSPIVISLSVLIERSVNTLHSSNPSKWLKHWIWNCSRFWSLIDSLHEAKRKSTSKQTKRPFPFDFREMLSSVLLWNRKISVAFNSFG